MRKIKALALLSGGLDSTLAIKVMLEEGIEVEAINFITPFCLCTPKGSCRYEARRVTDEFG
ncbi:7-cyano-7-deazaguanine synthase, partial [bacterium]|nr:7-cyano-7-deazaguanine synthase [bacterium]